LGLHICLDFFNDHRFGKFGQYKQQNDGAETTADAIKKGKAEYF